MFEYFTINDLFLNLIFPLLTTLVSLILTYFLFEPISNKKNLTNLTNMIFWSSRHLIFGNKSCI